MVIVLGTVLLSQTEPLSGGAGWIGAGLLGLVLFWLLVIHLPNKDKQIKELLEGKDKQISEIIAAFRSESKEGRTEFKEALSVIQTAADRRMNELSTTLRNEFERLNEK